MGGVSGAGPFPIQTRVIPAAQARITELIQELEASERLPKSDEKTAKIKKVVADLKSEYDIDVDKGTILVGPGKTPHQVEVLSSGNGWRPVKTLNSLTERAKMLWLHAPMMQEAAKKSSKAAAGNVEAKGEFEWSKSGTLSQGHIELDQALPPGKFKALAQYMGFIAPHPYERLVTVATGGRVAKPFEHIVRDVAYIAQEVFEHDPVPDYEEGVTYLTGKLVAENATKILDSGEDAPPYIKSLKEVIKGNANFHTVATAALREYEAEVQAALAAGQSFDGCVARLYSQIGTLCGPFVEELMKDTSWQKTKTAFGITRPDIHGTEEALKGIFAEMESYLKSAGTDAASSDAPPVGPRPTSTPGSVPASLTAGLSASPSIINWGAAASAFPLDSSGLGSEWDMESGLTSLPTPADSTPRPRSASAPVAVSAAPALPLGASPASAFSAGFGAGAAGGGGGVRALDVPAAAAAAAAAAATSTSTAEEARTKAIRDWAEENKAKIISKRVEDLVGDDKFIFEQFQELIKKGSDEVNKKSAVKILLAFVGEAEIANWLREFDGRVFTKASSPPK